jgi:hypothetical protein
MFSIAIAQLIVFFSFAHVQMFVLLTSVIVTQKNGVSYQNKWLPKTFV